MASLGLAPSFYLQDAAQRTGAEGDGQANAAVGQRHQLRDPGQPAVVRFFLKPERLRQRVS